MPGVATAGRVLSGSILSDHGAPLRAPSADTASQQTYYAAEAGGAGSPQRRSFLTSTVSEGDKRLLYAQGRPMAKDSSGSGSNWATGTTSAPQGMGQPAVESRFFFTGTVASTDMSRATDKREKDRLGIFGTSNSYAGAYGRVTSESIGRDLNPLGRGDGNGYLAGTWNLGMLYPAIPSSSVSAGTGNSVNNCDCYHAGNHQCASASDTDNLDAGLNLLLTAEPGSAAIVGIQITGAGLVGLPTTEDVPDVSSAVMSVGLISSTSTAGSQSGTTTTHRCCLVRKAHKKGWWSEPCNLPAGTITCRYNMTSVYRSFRAKYEGTSDADCMKKCNSGKEAAKDRDPSSDYKCVKGGATEQSYEENRSCGQYPNDPNHLPCRDIACRQSCLKALAKYRWYYRTHKQTITC